MKFRYSVAGTKTGTLLDSKGRMVKRPVIWLVLTGKDGDKIEVPAVIDSGADTTTLNIQYAEALGINLDEKKRGMIIGIGQGKVPTFRGTFNFRIKDMNLDMEVPAWFVDSENVNILLGQETFFDSFRIKFEKDHDTFEVSPSPKLTTKH